MQKNLSNPINRRYDDTVQVIADLYGASPDYIRKVIKDASCEKYKGIKPNAIRSAYAQYKDGKNNLIKAVERLFKVA